MELIWVCVCIRICVSLEVLKVHDTVLHNPPSDSCVEIFQKKPHNSKYCLRRQKITYGEHQK